MNEFDAIIVISDIAGFTQWLPMTTEGLVESKRRYIELTNRIITESGGEVVSFFGDCASCIFEISTEAMRQAQIGAGLVRLYKETSEFVLCDGARITPYIAVTAGRLIRTGDNFGGVRQGMPIFGSSLNFAMRLNSGCKHFKRNFLVSDHVPVIWPKEVVVQKISDITIKGLADTREIFAIEV